VYGAIGGVAAIALLAVILAVLCLRCRSRKHRAEMEGLKVHLTQQQVVQQPSMPDPMNASGWGAPAYSYHPGTPPPVSQHGTAPAAESFKDQSFNRGAHAPGGFAAPNGSAVPPGGQSASAGSYCAPQASYGTPALHPSPPAASLNAQSSNPPTVTSSTNGAPPPLEHS
jgi:hypothetical protein